MKYIAMTGSGLHAARGLIPGVTTVNKFGASPDGYLITN